MKSFLRKALLAGHRLGAMAASALDGHYVAADVPRARLVSHANWQACLLQLADRPGMRVLEIGSREVTGPSAMRRGFTQAEYTGFDYYAGPNVDVVGDAHELARHFAPGEFDLVFSSACFEHFAMPWVVAQQIARVLKVGGHVFVETHFSYSAHERPWHFFQFSDMALKVLFSRPLGFECVEAGVSNPMVGRFSRFADSYLRYRPIPALYCHSEYLGRKVEDVPFPGWDRLGVRDVVDGTEYPVPPSGAPAGAARPLPMEPSGGARRG